MDWISRQFPTRVVALLPVAIAINIVLGATVQQALKLPIYLDSIGTILVGVLAGPLAGLVTGVLSNLIWGYLLPAPIGSTTIGPFAIVAGVIGLLAGLWGRMGLFRDRSGETSGSSIGGAVVALGLVAVLAFYTYTRAYADPETYASTTFFDPATFDQSRILFLVVMAAFVGLIAWSLFLRRDLGAVYAVASGLVTGIAAAIVSAPISAIVFGGVTGGGTDLLVAAFRAGGASLLEATLQQGLLADPLDKMVTSFVVFFVLANLSRRVVARFPNGERLLGRGASTE
ncbi:MAG TPA: hypothetical protein VFK38_05345 [Candidatus Limnocylindrales bacterium]|nr:hypothetical protein [Candidatus Limnocylindrales bacterium]